MKRLVCFVITLMGLIGSAFANLEVYFMYSKFNSPEGQYIETYMSTIGSSTTLVKNAAGKFQSEIEVVMTFSRGDSIVNFEKYLLHSPEIDDTVNAVLSNFIDVQRIKLDNGTYNFNISIRDVNSEKPPYCFTDVIVMDFSESKMFGDIELIESYKKSSNESLISKNGFELVPYVANFFPQNMNSIKFYVEAYNTDTKLNDDFVLKYYIADYATGKEVASCSRFKKMSPRQVIPFIGELNIEKLPSGNYYLMVELVNRNNESVASARYFFQRQNSTMFSSA